ncbi:MAG: ABC transporter ATP-binding protein [Acidobacteria bacterium]|nr:MAG: ABC transporter ATP-binding protein [Acidobacteriota bacterium]
MIEAIDLTKRYEESTLALDALNLKVAPGEIYFLLGANGAGKTTVINIFLNFVEPTAGRALINGVDVTADALEAKKYLSYVSEDLMLYGNFTARQNLDFFARLGGKQGLKRDDYYQVLREVGLEERAFEQKVKEFSKGMRQKVGLAAAIVKDAPAILLDEPTSGLDPKVGAELMETLSELRSRRKAILVATHDIFRATEVADRIGIMKEGRKVMERTRGELEHEDLQTLYLDYMRGGFRTDMRTGTAGL